MTQVELLLPCFAPKFAVQDDDTDDESMVSWIDEEDMMYPISYKLDGEKCPHFDYQCKLNFEIIELVELPKKSSTLPLSVESFGKN